MATPHHKPLAGIKFHRLTAIKIVGYRSGNAIWKCLCDCKKTCRVEAYSLISGHTKSCGCWSTEVKTRRFTVHGGSFTPEHWAWIQARARCFSKNHRWYHRYGGRGITMCEEWRNDFTRFLNDMGLRPSKNHSLDRINNEGDYEPGNCRWATRRQQNINKTNPGNRILTEQQVHSIREEVIRKSVGESLASLDSRLALIYGVKPNTIQQVRLRIRWRYI